MDAPFLKPISPLPDAGLFARLRFLFHTDTCGVIAWGFVVLGILSRLVRYLLCTPLGLDEPYQAAAFLDHGYLDLLDPLPYEQVAPIGFLWIELTAVHLLGFSEWSLRLFPLLAGIGSILLVHHVARRLLDSLGALLCVATFSATYALMRYSCEVKPYGPDVFVAIGLLALACEWTRDPSRVRWLWLLAAFTPLAMCLSFPAVFVAGGISLALMPAIWRDGDRRAWIAYGALNVLLAGSFLGLHHFVLSRHYASSTHVMLPFWNDGFMPIGEPWRIPRWLLEMHTGDLLGYPYGGPNFQSAVTTLGCAIGIWACWSPSRRVLPLATLGMLGLAMVASALQRYPYGIHPRVVLYAAPLICLLFGAGVAYRPAWLVPDRVRRGVLGAFLLLLALLMVGFMARDIARPYRALREQIHRGFAHWIWTAEPEADTICVRETWKRDFYEKNQDAGFRCYAAIFCKPRRNTTPSVTLRCIVFHSDRAEIEQSRFDAWMSDVTQHYELVGREEFRLEVSLNNHLDTYEVFRFRRRGGSGVARRE